MRVAIIIATYGDEEWEKLARERAYPSACAQRYRFDALHDARPQVCLGHYPHATIAEARNRSAVDSDPTCDWLCFLDADDELAPGYLDAMKQALERAGDDGTPRLLMPAVSYVSPKRIARPPLMRPIGDLTVDNFMVIGTLVQRDLFLKVGGFDDYPHGFEDWALWAKCWKAGAQIVQVKRAVYVAHVNKNSKHRVGWRDRRWQVEMHNRVRAELFPELA